MDEKRLEKLARKTRRKEPRNIRRKNRNEARALRKDVRKTRKEEAKVTRTERRRKPFEDLAGKNADLHRRAKRLLMLSAKLGGHKEKGSPLIKLPVKASEPGSSVYGDIVPEETKGVWVPKGNTYKDPPTYVSSLRITTRPEDHDPLEGVNSDGAAVTESTYPISKYEERNYVAQKGKELFRKRRFNPIGAIKRAVTVRRMEKRLNGFEETLGQFEEALEDKKLNSAIHQKLDEARTPAEPEVA